MRQIFAAAIILWGLSAFPALRAFGQDNEPGPSTETVQSRPYLPPSPAKSVEIGDFYFKRKNYRAALDRYKEAAKTDSTYAPAYLGLGHAYEKIGLKRKALEAYRKYLDTLPSAKDAEEARSVHEAIDRLSKESKK